MGRRHCLLERLANSQISDRCLPDRRSLPRQALPLAAWGAVPHQDIFMQITLTGIKGERVSWWVTTRIQ
jgi:hypothetical protein